MHFFPPLLGEDTVHREFKINPSPRGLAPKPWRLWSERITIVNVGPIFINFDDIQQI